MFKKIGLEIKHTPRPWLLLYHCLLLGEGTFNHRKLLCRCELLQFVQNSTRTAASHSPPKWGEPKTGKIYHILFYN